MSFGKRRCLSNSKNYAQCFRGPSRRGSCSVSRARPPGARAARATAGSRGALGPRRRGPRAGAPPGRCANAACVEWSSMWASVPSCLAQTPRLAISFRKVFGCGRPALDRRRARAGPGRGRQPPARAAHRAARPRAPAAGPGPGRRPTPAAPAHARGAGRMGKGGRHPIYRLTTWRSRQMYFDGLGGMRRGARPARNAARDSDIAAPTARRRRAARPPARSAPPRRACPQLSRPGGARRGAARSSG